jgi:hypothetical protein
VQNAELILKDQLLALDLFGCFLCHIFFFPNVVIISIALYKMANWPLLVSLAAHRYFER